MHFDPTNASIVHYDPTNASNLAADDGNELWRTGGRPCGETASQNGTLGHVRDEEVLATRRDQGVQRW